MASPIPLYIHECPYCHTIHENAYQGHQWCKAHKDLFELWKRQSGRSNQTIPKRNYPHPPWLCPGCSKCEEEI